ncbi:hypothetical protein CYMTET_28718 [Cymbomonas tetramitiformis]|uniref:MYND-type domain-containing protein n=1 Tax=Cymbomonas tetramitiformis TaxID=36881 RepID=A0AAE0KVY6_9CHLO|nr:hypothetical protein CYMTET_28718 [Cymbomonas tetramitiformis]
MLYKDDLRTALVQAQQTGRSIKSKNRHQDTEATGKAKAKMTPNNPCKSGAPYAHVVACDGTGAFGICGVVPHRYGTPAQNFDLYQLVVRLTDGVRDGYTVPGFAQDLASMQSMNGHVPLAYLPLSAAYLLFVAPMVARTRGAVPPDALPVVAFFKRFAADALAPEHAALTWPGPSPDQLRQGCAAPAVSFSWEERNTAVAFRDRFLRPPPNQPHGCTSWFVEDGELLALGLHPPHADFGALCAKVGASSRLLERYALSAHHTAVVHTLRGDSAAAKTWWAQREQVLSGFCNSTLLRCMVLTTIENSVSQPVMAFGQQDAAERTMPEAGAGGYLSFGYGEGEEASVVEVLKWCFVLTDRYSDPFAPGGEAHDAEVLLRIVLKPALDWVTHGAVSVLRQHCDSVSTACGRLTTQQEEALGEKLISILTNTAVLELHSGFFAQSAPVPAEAEEELTRSCRLIMDDARAAQAAERIGTALWRVACKAATEARGLSTGNRRTGDHGGGGLAKLVAPVTKVLVGAGGGIGLQLANLARLPEPELRRIFTLPVAKAEREAARRALTPRWFEWVPAQAGARGGEAGLALTQETARRIHAEWQEEAEAVMQDKMLGNTKRAVPSALTALLLAASAVAPLTTVGLWERVSENGPTAEGSAACKLNEKLQRKSEKRLAKMSQKCVACHRSATEAGLEHLLRCTGCNLPEARYCSRACQKSMWAAHKPQCKAASR